MAAKDLITPAHAKQDIQAITDNTQDALLTTLITAISDAIAKYCRRDSVSRFDDELYSGNGERRADVVLYAKLAPAAGHYVANSDISHF